MNNLCIGTSRVMKVVAEFHRNCVCGFGEESKYIFWAATPHRPPSTPIFFYGVTKLWYTMNDESCGEVSSELCVSFIRRKQIPFSGAMPL